MCTTQYAWDPYNETQEAYVFSNTPLQPVDAKSIKITTGDDAADATIQIVFSSHNNGIFIDAAAGDATAKSVLFTPKNRAANGKLAIAASDLGEFDVESLATINNVHTTLSALAKSVNQAASTAGGRVSSKRLQAANAALEQLNDSLRAQLKDRVRANWSQLYEGSSALYQFDEDEPHLDVKNSKTLCCDAFALMTGETSPAEKDDKDKDGNTQYHGFHGLTAHLVGMYIVDLKIALEDYKNFVLSFQTGKGIFIIGPPDLTIYTRVSA